jgi:hypothetical protein
MSAQTPATPAGVNPMNSVPGAFDLVRKTLLFALLGAAVIFLAGPIGVVLGFAIVGFLVWLVINLMVNGFRSTGETVRRTFGGLGHAIAGTARFGKKAVVSVVKLPVKAAVTAVKLPVKAVAAAVKLPIMAWDKMWNVGGNAFVWFFEIASGLLAGALIGAIYDKNTGIREVAVLFGALAGTMLGVLVAHSHKKRASEPMDALPAE